MVGAGLNFDPSPHDDPGAVSACWRTYPSGPDWQSLSSDTA